MTFLDISFRSTCSSACLSRFLLSCPSTSLLVYRISYSQSRYLPEFPSASPMPVYLSEYQISCPPACLPSDSSVCLRARQSAFGASLQPASTSLLQEAKLKSCCSWHEIRRDNMATLLHCDSFSFAFLSRCLFFTSLSHFFYFSRFVSLFFLIVFSLLLFSPFFYFFDFLFFSVCFAFLSRCLSCIIYFPLIV